MLKVNGNIFTFKATAQNGDVKVSSFIFDITTKGFLIVALKIFTTLNLKIHPTI